jgi:hypothetical protein
LLIEGEVVYDDINILYSDEEHSEFSYVENLIRPYNQLMLIEQAKIIWNVNRCMVYKKFVIPVDGLTRQQAEQSIYEKMSAYYDDIKFDDITGEINFNGENKIPFSKDYWFPSNGKDPQIDINVPDIKNDDTLSYFKMKFEKATKIPASIREHEQSDSEDILFNNLINHIIKKIEVLWKKK